MSAKNGITAEEAAAIRAELARPRINTFTLAADYGVSPQTIRLVVHGERGDGDGWKLTAADVAAIRAAWATKPRTGAAIARDHGVPDWRIYAVRDKTDGGGGGRRGDASRKLSPDQVRAMRDRYRPYMRGCGYRALGAEYGVSAMTAFHAIRGDTHRSVQ